MSRPMTISELGQLIKFISASHTPYSTSRVRVKYMTPHIDFRTYEVFSVEFRGYGEDKVLHCQNECSQMDKTLYERCIDYLEGKDAD